MNLFDSFYDQEYLCGIVTGSHRKGKTLLLAFYALMCYTFYDKIYANFNLRLPNAVKIDDFNYDIMSKIAPNSLVLVTELHHYLDCRKTYENIDLTEALQEIGKKHSHFIGDIKKVSMLDIRMRDLFTFSIYAYGSRKRVDPRFKDVYKYALYHDPELNFCLNYPEQVIYFYMKDVYPIYDTEEFIVLKAENKEEEIKEKRLTDF